MNTIDKIKSLFVLLPSKDIVLANEFLNKRDFLNLKDLVDSDVTKAYNIFIKLMPEDENGECSEAYVRAQVIYEDLKDLQALVDKQAAAFEIDEVEYYEPLND
jgi:hypothetical protein